MDSGGDGVVAMGTNARVDLQATERDAQVNGSDGNDLLSFQGGQFLLPSTEVGDCPLATATVAYSTAPEGAFLAPFG